MGRVLAPVGAALGSSSTLVRSASSKLLASVDDSNSPLRGLRVPTGGPVALTSPLKHLPRTTCRPGRPGATGRGPPHEVGPDTPRRERGRPDRDEFARSRRRRAVLRACTPVGSRGRPRRSRVWGMLCGSAARARGPDGGAPACQVRATPRGPRGTRARAALRVRTTDDRRYWLCGMRLCGYDYEAAMATWIEATGLAARRSSAPARRARGATRRYDVL